MCIYPQSHTCEQQSSKCLPIRMQTRNQRLKSAHVEHMHKHETCNAHKWAMCTAIAYIQHQYSMSRWSYNPHNGVYILLTDCASLLWKKRHHKRPSGPHSWVACAAAENSVIRIRSNGHRHCVRNVPKPPKRLLGCADLSSYEKNMAKKPFFGPKNAPTKTYFCKPLLQLALKMHTHLQIKLLSSLGMVLKLPWAQIWWMDPAMPHTQCSRELIWSSQLL